MVRRLVLGLTIGGGLVTACGGSDDTGGPDTTLVHGQVISNRSRAGIAGATVTIRDLIQFGNDDYSVSTTTDAEGRFSASVEYFACEGLSILATYPGYAQPTPFPHPCPGSSPLIELDPNATASEITPRDPTVHVSETVEFHTSVTFADGTSDPDGPAAWLIGAVTDIADASACGMVPDVGSSRGTTYTAPPSPPPAECGGSMGQVAIVAAPVGALGFSSLDASDTVLVTVLP
jgi:hypothetical protein